MTLEEEKLTLEIKKLTLETTTLEAGLKTDWTKTYWPVACAIVVGLASLLTYLAARDWQQWLDRRSQIESGLLWATDKGNDARRAAGASALGPQWGHGFDDMISSTLVALLVDSNPLVRRASLESIEFAVYGQASIDACANGRTEAMEARRIRLLYGDSAHDVRGLITRHLAALEGLSESEYLADGWPPRDVSTKAAKDAIRKNWECLRRANFRGLDLAGIDLFLANLQQADLREVNFRWANLWHANLSGAIVFSQEPHHANEMSVLSVEYANIGGLVGADAFRTWAISHRAVEMTRDDYRHWKARWETQSSRLETIDWNQWAHDGYRVDRQGCPITSTGSSVLAVGDSRSAFCESVGVVRVP